MAKNTKTKNNKKRVIWKGFFYSPFVKGLVGLLPIFLLAGFAVGQTVNRNDDYRNFLLKYDLVEEEKLELISLAIKHGDLGFARSEYERGIVDKVLGANTEIEDKLWPERVIRRRIEELEEELKTGIESREVNLRLMVLYLELGDKERAKEYFLSAERIDPNDETVMELRELFF